MVSNVVHKDYIAPGEQRLQYSAMMLTIKTKEGEILMENLGS